MSGNIGKVVARIRRVVVAISPLRPMISFYSRESSKNNSEECKRGSTRLFAAVRLLVVVLLRSGIDYGFSGMVGWVWVSEHK